MNRFITNFLILVVAVLLTTEVVLAQTWRLAAEGTFSSFNDIFFVSTTTGFAASTSGAIYKSTDAGLTWERKESFTTASIKSLYFINESVGYAGGANRYLLKTVDGGENWVLDSVMTIPDAAGGIEALYFSDANNGWILASTSSAGWALRTTDGGANWTLNLTVAKQLNAMSFSEANKGIIVGKDVATLYYTTNGSNWILAPTPSLGGFTYTRSDVRAVYMVNSTTAYATGWGSAAAGLQPSIHLKTTDGGASWTYMTQLEENRTYENMWGIHFKDAMNGVAVGGASRGSVVVRTSDGGQNWVPIPAPFGSTIYGIYGIGDKLWIDGNAGLIATSNDFGENWELLTPIPSATIYGLAFPSSSVGYAAGFDGVLIKSTDGGMNWKGGYLTVGFRTLNINDIYFLNEDVGYAAHSYRMVAKTTDGGETWSAIIPDTLSVVVSSQGVHFVDERLGFVVGKLATGVDIIYRTTDGGSSWTEQTNLVSKTIQKVAFANENNGIAVAEGLKAVYTTNSGINWTQSQFLNVPSALAASNLRSVVFLNSNEAVAVGDKIILKTNDGGANFQYIETGASVLLYSVVFRNDTVYASGKGEVWMSADMGNNWTNILDTNVVSTTNTLYSVAVDNDGYVWVSSAGSRIFTTKPDTPVTVEPDVNAVLNFNLDQNYPNPFNPSTVISWQSPVDCWQVLKVFDVLGNEIATLVDEYKPAGSYKAEFDASRLSSGVYFYQLRFGGAGTGQALVQTKKMILVK